MTNFDGVFHSQFTNYSPGITDLFWNNNCGLIEALAELCTLIQEICAGQILCGHNSVCRMKFIDKFCTGIILDKLAIRREGENFIQIVISKGLLSIFICVSLGVSVRNYLRQLITKIKAISVLE